MNSDNILLFIIDMQNDFLTGTLANPAAVRCIPEIQEAVIKASEIMLTMDGHDAETYYHTQEGRKLPVKHCIKGTPGWQIHPEIMDAVKMAHTLFGVPFSALHKKQFACDFCGFDDVRRKHDLPPVSTFSKVVFCGTCTDICVLSTIVTFKSEYPEMPIAVIANACAGTTPSNHEASLKVLKSLQVEII